MKNNYSDFGKEVKKKLIEIDKTQEWLIAEIKKDTGLFVDSSYLNRILTGRNNNPKIIASIKKILSIEGDEALDTWIAEIIGKMHINKITQLDIAERTGYTNDYVSMILLGKKESPTAKKKICQAVDEIIGVNGGETEMSANTQFIAARLRECLDYLENGAEIEPVKPVSLKAPPTTKSMPQTDGNGKLMFMSKGYEVDLGQTVTLSDKAVGIINQIWSRTGLTSTEIIDRMLEYAYENSEFY